MGVFRFYANLAVSHALINMLEFRAGSFPENPFEHLDDT